MLATLERRTRMNPTDPPPEGVESLDNFNEKQIQHFQGADARCRGLQLPEGILLRYTLSSALYFYLRTAIQNGKISTRVYASDSPYDREKAHIGEITTPMTA